MKSKFFLFAIVALALVACNNNEPAQSFEGTYKVMNSRSESSDIAVITADSIKLFLESDGKYKYNLRYQSHYTVNGDSTVELERCWLKITAENTPDFWYNEEEYITTEHMYFDKDGYLIIKYFDRATMLAQIFPNYAILKLQRL